MYYDETNSHPLNVDVFFADIPTSTQPMELDGEEVIIYLFIYLFALILKKINIYLRWRVTTNLLMKEMSHLQMIDLKVLLLPRSQHPLP